MLIHSLSQILIGDLVTVFNKAFEGYFLPIQLNEQQLSDKIKSENIQLEYSVGVTIEGQLVAFILTGVDFNQQQTISYNAGTGVIPEFRGLHLTEKMYAYLLPILEKQNISKHQLEVITQNTKALRIYEQIGYTITKTVSCFKGNVIPPSKETVYDFVKLDAITDTLLPSFWNHNPTYQNTLSSINRNKAIHETIGAFDSEELIAYIIYVKNSGRIRQFGVHPNYRNNGIGHRLFYEAQKANPTADVVLINSDNADFKTHSFLKKIGLDVFIEQFEMSLQN
ncbi:MAG: GNAT family N-acetyltransferase [Bacteroidota bacterium]